MCWCVGKAASGIKEFYMLPVNKKLMQYDNLAVCTIVANQEGEVSSAMFLSLIICGNSMPIT